MSANRTWWMIAAATALAGVLGAPASAQTIKTGRTAFDNLSASYARERVPGAMVDAGFSRAVSAADAGRAQVTSPDITETEPPTSLRHEFVVDAMVTMVDQLINTIQFLGNRLLARAGLMPLLPSETFFSDTGTGGGSTTDGDTSDGTGTDGDTADGSADGTTGDGSTDRGDRDRSDRT